MIKQACIELLWQGLERLGDQLPPSPRPQAWQAGGTRCADAAWHDIESGSERWGRGEPDRDGGASCASYVRTVSFRIRSYWRRFSSWSWSLKRAASSEARTSSGSR